jgi:hypothetical protein
VITDCYVLEIVPTVDLAGIAAFEMEYAHWVEEQQKQIFELRNALQAHVSEIELNILVENGLNHYYNLFRMKADAAKADVFYLLYVRGVEKHQQNVSSSGLV